MAVSKPLLQALRGETLSRPPFWFMRQAGRYLPEYKKIRTTAKNFLDFCYTPDLALEVTLQPLRRYQMDAAILFSDILVIPDGLGADVAFVEGRGPVLTPITTEAQIATLQPGRMLEALAPVYQAVSKIAANLDDKTALIGFAGAPWTVAIYMVEGHGGTDCGTARTWAYREPQSFAKLIDILIDATAAHLIEQVKNGADVLQIFDSWAGVLGESQFRRWVIEPNAAVVKKVKAACPDVPIIGFPRAAGAGYQAFVADTGVDGVSMDQTVPVQWAADHLQGKVTVQGNLDNRVLVAGGTALEDETRRILGVLSKGPFIFNLGHGVLPETPPEHVGLVADIIKGWPGSG